MTDGILILNKPREWTSHDCVAVCRRALGIKKIGHGGTLDPMAEGLLPVFVGRATRIMEYMNFDHKTYLCTTVLGIVTDTFDIWGKTVKTSRITDICKEDVERSLREFIGDIKQIPPKFSAIKVKGKKLYEYARAGEDVEIRPRAVHISDIDIKKIDMQKGEVNFEVTCSKGTYIRSLCNDLGEKLGCGAVMSYLKRTAVGVFDLDGAISPEDIKSMEAEDIEKFMKPIDFPLVRFGKAEINDGRAEYFVNGGSIRINQAKLEGTALTDETSLYRVYRNTDGKFLGLARYCEDSKILKAEKIFTTRQEI